MVVKMGTTYLKKLKMRVNIWISEEFLESLHLFLCGDCELADNFEYFLRSPEQTKVNILHVVISFDEYIRLKDY